MGEHVDKNKGFHLSSANTPSILDQIKAPGSVGRQTKSTNRNPNE
jgi:hypothetical protein